MMLARLAYYLFYSSAVMVYGIGISKSALESRSLKNARARYLKGLGVMCSTSILTWLFSIGLLIPNDMGELFPFFCVFIFATLSVFTEVLLRLTARVSASDFAVPFLCALLAVGEGLSVVDTLLISALSLTAFFLSTLLMAGIRKRMELSDTAEDVEGRGLLLVSLAVVLMATLAFSVTWLNHRGV